MRGVFASYKRNLEVWKSGAQTVFFSGEHDYRSFEGLIEYNVGGKGQEVGADKESES